MKITHSVLSDAGPRVVNEDTADCWLSGDVTMACVADGLGGMGGGDIASQLAVASFRAFLNDKEKTEETLIAAARDAHSKIRSAQQSGERQKRMATTLTAVALTTEGLIGVHCGDSRAAIARGKGIKKLTRDHSEGQRLFEAGKLTKDELATYQRRHILESALGDKDEPRIEAFSLEIRPGDRVFLTSDGVHNIILLRELQKMALVSPNPSDLVDKIRLAINERGAIDNFSIAVIYVD
ncbi:PP2C family serine/threonine-protein phosphatase [uncultured Agrobacterium sp.]|uniref:PP2C family protein-serine/threonine phosphatase n=1 Tax=uncultured Agrobacterium sp. TaxID=157277 RepID=UPI0025D5309F|nr:PP2C family serine/threonine-protein phosphatase [uncultured Agrobacterium sp.]